MQNVFNANTFNTNGAGIFNLAPATNACRTCHKEKGRRWYRVLGNWLKRQPKATLSTLARRVRGSEGQGMGQVSEQQEPPAEKAHRKTCQM